MSAPYPTYDDEEAAMYREEDHDREDFEICRWCEEQVLADSIVDGYCPECLEKNGLVQCLNCGKAIKKETAVLGKTRIVEYYTCPKCV